MYLPRLLIFLFIVFIAGCQPAVKNVKIGIVNYHSQLDPAFDGLRAGLVEQGFVDNIEYIYAGSAEQDLQALEHEVQRLLDLKVDMLFTMGTVPTQAAKNVLAQHSKAVPVVFSPLINPVEEGFVHSLAHPKTGITGVHNANMAGKALEWLTLLMPDTQTIVTFFHPDDRVSATLLSALEDAVTLFSLELLPVAITEPEAAFSFLAGLDRHHTLLIMPTPRLGPQKELQQYALAAGIPVFGYNNPAEFTLASFAVDWFHQGKQASYLVSRILSGADPTTVAVEAADSFLYINLANIERYQFSVDYRWLSLAQEVIK